MRNTMTIIMLVLAVAGAGCSSFIGAADAPPYAPPVGPRLESISVEQALAAPQRFSNGVTISCVRKVSGETTARIHAVGQVRQVPVPGQAIFYTLSNRADVVVMHDRFVPWMDTLRIYNFSPSGVRERVCSHRTLENGYNIRRYERFELASSGNLSVTEELAAFHPAVLQARKNRYSVPLD